MNRLNRSFCESGWPDQFVTLIIAVLDPTTGSISIANAGHMPPLVRHNASPVEMPGQEYAGFPIGVDADAEYGSFDLTLEPGDCLAMFTDGLSEAMNSSEELFGLARMQQRFSDPIADAPALGRHLLDDVQRHVEDHPQSDDMCLVCIART